MCNSNDRDDVTQQIFVNRIQQHGGKFGCSGWWFVCVLTVMPIIRIEISAQKQNVPKDFLTCYICWSNRADRTKVFRQKRYSGFGPFGRLMWHVVKESKGFKVSNGCVKLKVLEHITLIPNIFSLRARTNVFAQVWPWFGVFFFFQTTTFSRMFRAIILSKTRFTMIAVFFVKVLNGILKNYHSR